MVEELCSRKGLKLVGVWIMHKEEEEKKKLKGSYDQAGLLNSDIKQLTCSTFADHHHPCLVQLGG
jgi:hypothetical protein